MSTSRWTKLPTYRAHGRMHPHKLSLPPREDPTEKEQMVPGLAEEMAEKKKMPREKLKKQKLWLGSKFRIKCMLIKVKKKTPHSHCSPASQIFTAPTATLWTRPGLGLATGVRRWGSHGARGMRILLSGFCALRGPSSGLAECSGPSCSCPVAQV